jgi:hypothetical protein
MSLIGSISVTYRLHVTAWIVVAAMFALAQEARGGWVIDQAVRGGGEGARQQVLIQADRMKTLFLGEDGGPAMAFILDLDAQTITQVEYERRQYVTSTVQEFVQMMRGAMESGLEQMAQAMKQMQESLKDMPPEQRKMVEEMMRSRMPQGGPGAEACRETRTELKKTGQQATIAGYSATRYDVLADGTLETELWIAKEITAWRELDPKKLERFSAEMATLAGCGPGKSRRGLPAHDPAWKLAHEGYPVRVVSRAGGEVTVEVVKAERRTVPMAEFQPPAGFARKSAREMMMGR